jgi:hypothetical protein
MNESLEHPNPSHEKGQPKRHRRETRPAIAKRYKMDGGCIMMMYYDDVL